MNKGLAAATIVFEEEEPMLERVYKCVYNTVYANV